MSEKATYYKVLVEGRSPYQNHYRWSLPVFSGGKWTPGEWHEIEGELCPHRNGLHITSDPILLRGDFPKGIAYEVEYDGEIVGDGYSNKSNVVASRVRLVRRAPWASFRCPDRPEPVSPPAGDSPAYLLLKHVWKCEGKKGGASWVRTNHAMGQALSLAIFAGLEFFPGDFARFAKEFNSGYWIGDGEWYYAKACGRDRDAHGGNPSAYQAYEAWRGRKPFIVHGEASPGPKVRLSVGESFDWHLNLKSKVRVTVTSFVDNPKDYKPPYVVACSYKRDDGATRKIDKRFAITHDAIAEYHKAIREHKKNSKVEAEVPA